MNRRDDRTPFDPPDVVDGVWTRQPEETSRAYEVFCIYRDMGPGRSLRKAHDEEYGKTAGNLRYVERWASANDWKQRAEQYDDHIDRLARAELEGERLHERMNRIKLLKAARGKLARALTRLDPAKMTATELLRGIDIVTKQLRKEYDDEPKRRVEVTGKDGDPLQHRHSAGERLMEALEAEVEGSARGEAPQDETAAAQTPDAEPELRLEDLLPYQDQ